MDGEQKFWMAVIKMVLVFFSILVISASGCSIHKQRIELQMLETGHSAAEIYCFLELNTASSTSGTDLLLCQHVFRGTADSEQIQELEEKTREQW